MPASTAPSLTFDGIEKLNLTSSNDPNDLLIAMGAGGSYDGRSGIDALYADWSTATNGITWNNLANSTVQVINGVSIAGMERLLLQTGSGNDNISNSAVSTDDEILTGAGDDTVEAGPGNDIFDGGTGFDTSSDVSATSAVVAQPAYRHHQRRRWQRFIAQHQGIDRQPL